MSDSPPVPSRSVRLRLWPGIAAAAVTIGLLTAVAVDGSEADPTVPVTTTDDALYRQLENEGRIPRPYRDVVNDVTRRLVNEGRIPSAVLE